MRSTRQAVIGAAAACLVAPLLIPTAAAAHGDRGSHHSQYEVEGVRTVATGLASPRGLDISRSGDVYVALSGSGAADAVDPVCVDAGALGVRCFGETGAIGKLDTSRHGKKSTEVRIVVDGLPSLAGPDGFEAIGPTDVSFDHRGGLYATIGLGADPALALEGGAFYPEDVNHLLASVVKVDARRGTVEKVADVATFESGDPDGRGPDTNPYSLVAGRTGQVVADAGGNTLLGVRDGAIETLAVFPDEAPQPVPFPPFEIPPQPVPNAVVKGPDGAYYVGQLTGFPFAPGTATVWRVVPGQEPQVYADGFTNIIDLAFTDRGDLLVLEISHTGLASETPEPGALHVVPRRDPAATYQLDVDLAHPGGIAVKRDTVYVSTHTTSTTDGEILRFHLDD